MRSVSSAIHVDGDTCTCVTCALRRLAERYRMERDFYIKENDKLRNSLRYYSERYGKIEEEKAQG